MKISYQCEHCDWTGNCPDLATEHEKNCKVANCEHQWGYAIAENRYTNGGWLSRTCDRCGTESGYVEITQEMCAAIFEEAGK